MSENEEEDKEEKESKDLIIKQKEGLTFSYYRENLEQYYPHLMSEIKKKTSVVRIESVDYNDNKNKEKVENTSFQIDQKELRNPSALDFLRRCSSNEEAYEILDYLLKRNELSKTDYEKYLNCIEKENGLKILIEESGGFKERGYYFRKYYYPNLEKNTNSQNVHKKDTSKSKNK
ncbi:MAG: DUF2095 family protein [Promethearchaeota archaeon]